MDRARSSTERTPIAGFTLRQRQLPMNEFLSKIHPGARVFKLLALSMR
jgi:hypothetical protein